MTVVCMVFILCFFNVVCEYTCYLHPAERSAVRLISSDDSAHYRSILRRPVLPGEDYCDCGFEHLKTQSLDTQSHRWRNIYDDVALCQVSQGCHSFHSCYDTQPAEQLSVNRRDASYSEVSTLPRRHCRCCNFIPGLWTIVCTVHVWAGMCWCLVLFLSMDDSTCSINSLVASTW